MTHKSDLENELGNLELFWAQNHGALRSQINWYHTQENQKDQWTMISPRGNENCCLSFTTLTFYIIQIKWMNKGVRERNFSPREKKRASEEYRWEEPSKVCALEKVFQLVCLCKKEKSARAKNSQILSLSENWRTIRISSSVGTHFAVNNNTNSTTFEWNEMEEKESKSSFSTPPRLHQLHSFFAAADALMNSLVVANSI